MSLALTKEMGHRHCRN